LTVPMDPPIQLIDTHVHFDRFSPEEVEAVVRRAREAGVYRVIAVAMGEASCHSLLRWKLSGLSGDRLRRSSGGGSR
jgi:TatD DNase family protein